MFELGEVMQIFKWRFNNISCSRVHLNTHIYFISRGIFSLCYTSIDNNGLGWKSFLFIASKQQLKLTMRKFSKIFKQFLIEKAWLQSKRLCLRFFGLSLREKCPYSELFWSELSRIRTRITPYLDTFYVVFCTHLVHFFFQWLF